MATPSAPKPTERSRVATKERNFLDRFARLSFFSYLDSFSEIITFQKLLIFVLMILNVALFITGFWLYTSLHESSAKLLYQANALSTYLSQQRVLNSKTLATRIANEYYSITFENSAKFLDSMMPLVHPQRYGELKAEFDELLTLINKGQVRQRVMDIDYSRMTSTESRSKEGLTMFHVRIPMTVKSFREGAESVKEARFYCGILLVAQEPSLNNPYGLSVWKIGAENTAEKRDR